MKHWEGLLLAVIIVWVRPVAPAVAADVPVRHFLLHYDTDIHLPPETPARIWIPMPPTNDEQSVELVEQNFATAPQSGQDPASGNRMLYTQADANAHGDIPIHLTFKVTRRQIAAEPASALLSKNDPALQPNKLIPINGRPQSLLSGVTLPGAPLAKARVLYDVVYRNMTYRKDKPGYGRGDAAWACDSHFGNCTDFHSLFISLARSEGLPAKFEIGFGLPERRGTGVVSGYHCWAKVLTPEQGWVPVDISEASKHPEKKEFFFGHLCENRVAFSTGRDLTLVPPQDGPPLNYFVYPYVEVAGKPLADDKVSRSFSYEDVDMPATQPAGQ